MNKFVIYLVAVTLLIMAFLSGYTGLFIGDNPPDNGDVPPGEIETFIDSDNPVCYQDGKPIIRMFSTTWCQHCEWIIDVHDFILKEYADAGKIIAYHWELDTGDNTITPEKETEVPQSEIAIFDQFNPRNSIPTYVYGCKYYRIGNGYEQQQDLLAEEAEFRTVIEALL